MFERLKIISLQRCGKNTKRREEEDKGEEGGKKGLKLLGDIHLILFLMVFDQGDGDDEKRQEERDEDEEIHLQVLVCGDDEKSDVDQ